MVEELLPTARDLMVQGVAALRPSLDVLDAVERLGRENEDTAFVVDEQDRLVGILTEKNCLKVLAARAYDEANAETVADVMIANPPCLAPETDVYAVAQTFLSYPAGILPVVENDRIIGGVSQLILLRIFLTVFRHRAAASGELEQTAVEMKDRPTSIERMQQVFARIDRNQLVRLLRRSK